MFLIFPLSSLKFAIPEMGDTCTSCGAKRKEDELEDVARALLPTKPLPKTSTLKLDFVTSDHSYNRWNRYDPDQGDTKVVEQPSPSRSTIQRLKSVPKQPSIQCLIDCGAIAFIYVPRDASNRWALSKRLVDRIKVSGELHKEGAAALSSENHNSLLCEFALCFSVPNEYGMSSNEPIYHRLMIFAENTYSDRAYKKMTCFLLTNISAESWNLKGFAQMVLDTIASTKNIYLVDLNSVPMDCLFFNKLMEVLIARKSESLETKKAAPKREGKYGPEVVDMENVSVFSKESRGVAMELVTRYIRSNIRDLRWLKLGYFYFIDFPRTSAESLCSAVLQNDYLMKVDVDLKYSRLKQQMEQRVKQNKNTTRRKRKITF